MVLQKLSEGVWKNKKEKIMFTQDLDFGIINTHKNLIAKAQSRVWFDQKGSRSLNHLSLRPPEDLIPKRAVVASPERAEKNPHVANAKGRAWWPKHPENPIIFQWRSMPR